MVILFFLAFPVFFSAFGFLAAYYSISHLSFSTKDGFFDKLVRRGGSHGAFVIYFAYFEVAKVDNPDNDLDL